jgi:predicted DNA-binding WGR domain protein
MTTRTIYYTNTKPGHAKDYEIVADDTALTMTTRWGRIGGPKTEDVKAYGNVRSLWAALSNAMTKRESRGYDLVSDSESGMTGMVVTPLVSTPSAVGAPEVSRSALLADIREMERAERM